MNFSDVKRRAYLSVPVWLLPVQRAKRQKQQDMKPNRNEKGVWDVFPNKDFHFFRTGVRAVMPEFFLKPW